MLVTTHYMEEAQECDRLVIMADGRVVAEGTAAEIVGSRQVVVVEAESWSAAFGALERSGLQVALAGRGLRVPGADPPTCGGRSGICPRSCGRRPRRLEERFFELSQQPSRRRGGMTATRRAGGRPDGRPAGGRQRDEGGHRRGGPGAVRRAWLPRRDDPRDRGRGAGGSGARASLLRHQGGPVRRRDAAAGGAERGADRRADGAGAAAAAGAEPGFGAHLVRTALQLWESDELKETFLGLLRSAVTSEQAAVMLREFISDSILGTVARVAGLGRQWSPAEAEYRAAMVATQMLGLALTRLVLGLPAVAGASVDELAATVGPSVERYLSGDIDLPASTHGADRRTGDGLGVFRRHEGGSRRDRRGRR